VKTPAPGFVLAAACLLLILPTARAHVPVPDSVLNPQTAPEAWNVIRLATTNIGQLLQENRLAEIPDQASLCSPALRALARLANPPPEPQKRLAEQTVRAAVAINALAQSGVAGDRAFAQTTFENLRAILREMESSFDAATVNGNIFFCPMHPEVCRTDPAALCDKCGMSLLLRRIPYSFIYVPPGESSMRLEAIAETPLSAGRAARVKVRLSKRDGAPVLLSDLMVMHTQPIHLLIVDPALEDYHHEHPLPTDAPGEYAFSFTPAKNSSYRIFADLTPTGAGVQEYVFGDLPGETKTPPTAAPRESAYAASSGGLNFQLAIEGSDSSPLQARQARNLRITVSEADGKPVQRLEPVMNAFAHLVGFYEDYRTVVHLHPAGAEVTNQSLRGGPSLDFKFYPPKSGFIRLYCQVLVDGRTIFAPFNLQVAP
jgi:hypothetical protein